MGFLKLLTNTAKTIAGNKTAQQILRYIASSTLAYASKKMGVSQYKYDVDDNRNMVYQYNMNNNNKIDPLMSDMASNLYKIDRMLKETEDTASIQQFLNSIAAITNQSRLIEELKENYFNNKELFNFDSDTLETSSIADKYEINSGGIYVPNKEIITITPEGHNVADLKNEYLENRLMLGDNPSEEDVYKLLQEYHRKNKTKEVTDYFNSLIF